jgi:hypothetical protein
MNVSSFEPQLGFLLFDAFICMAVVATCAVCLWQQQICGTCQWLLKKLKKRKEKEESLAQELVPQKRHMRDYDSD